MLRTPTLHSELSIQRYWYIIEHFQVLGHTTLGLKRMAKICLNRSLCKVISSDKLE